MTDLPRHPEANDDVGVAPHGRSSTSRPMLVYVAVAVVALLLVLVVVLHLTGVVGPGAH